MRFCFGCLAGDEASVTIAAARARRFITFLSVACGRFPVGSTRFISRAVIGERIERVG